MISFWKVMEMPQQLKMKSASKTVKLNVNMSQVKTFRVSKKLNFGFKASKARIVDKPWKFSTKNVDECNICSNELFSVCHPHISRCAMICRYSEYVLSSTQHS